MSTHEPLHVEYGPNFTVRLPGEDWFQPAGKFGRGGVLPRLARMLQAKGIDPNTPLHVTRDGIPAWRENNTIGYWASKSASEPDGASVRLVPYIAMPKYWNTETEGSQQT